jgi:protein-disulfide isomerase
MPTARTKKTTSAVSEPITEPVIEPIVDSELPTPIEDTVTFKRSHFYSVLTVLAFAAGVLLGYVVWGMGSAGGGVQSSQTANQSNGPVVEAATEQPKYVRYNIPTDGFYSIGPSNAQITIVEFSDYQCPYCRRWHDQVYKPLLAAYPGKVKFVYRNLPLTSIHPNAFPAAEAAMCAGEQNVYWQYHDKLFDHETLGNEVYIQYAQELGLDMTAFEACLNDHKYQKAIQTDSDFAINLGISSTPTFFINGLAIVGAQPLDVFKEVIDKELAGEIPQQ